MSDESQRCSPPPLNPKLGQVLKRFRKASNLRLRDVQDKCGLSLGYVSAIERGKNLPSLDALVRLASVYAIPASEVFTAIEKELDKHD